MAQFCWLVKSPLFQFILGGITKLKRVVGDNQTFIQIRLYLANQNATRHREDIAGELGVQEGTWMN